MTSDAKLRDLVKRYRTEPRKRSGLSAQQEQQVEERDFRSCNSLAAAISKAIDSRDLKNCRHSHQWCIAKHVYPEAKQLLLGAKGQLSRSRSFAELHHLVDQAIGGIHGAGPLFVYDVAARLGLFLQLQAELIYLHAGTKIGARKLLAVPRLGQTLGIEKLPKVLHSLTPAELESFLCIYAKDFD